MTFVKFTSIQFRVAAGQKFKIEFEFLNQDGKQSFGTCIALVRLWEILLKFLNYLLLVLFNHLQSIQENQNQNEGWSTQNYKFSELQNGAYAFGSSYNKFANVLLKKSIKIISVSNIEQQVTTGVNFKISFIYLENNNLKTGKAIIYAQEWTQTIKINSLELTQSHSILTNLKQSIFLELLHFDNL